MESVKRVGHRKWAGPHITTQIVRIGLNSLKYKDGQTALSTQTNYLL